MAVHIYYLVHTNIQSTIPVHTETNITFKTYGLDIFTSMHIYTLCKLTTSGPCFNILTSILKVSNMDWLYVTLKRKISQFRACKVNNKDKRRNRTVMIKHAFLLWLLLLTVQEKPISTSYFVPELSSEIPLNVTNMS